MSEAAGHNSYDETGLIRDFVPQHLGDHGSIDAGISDGVEGELFELVQPAAGDDALEDAGISEIGSAAPSASPSDMSGLRVHAMFSALSSQASGQERASLHSGLSQLKSAYNNKKKKGSKGTSLASRSRSRLSVMVPFSRWTGEKKVTFDANITAETKKGIKKSGSCRRMVSKVSGGIAACIFFMETYWVIYGRPLVVITSLFELWSMGIWLGFLTEPEMAKSLVNIVIVDIVCNCFYIVDTLFMLARLYREERIRNEMTRKEKELREERRREALERQEQGKKTSAQNTKNNTAGGGGMRTPASMEAPTASVQVAMMASSTDSMNPMASDERSYAHRRKRFRICRECLPQCVSSEQGRRKLKVNLGLFLAFGMVPVQVLLVSILQTGSYLIWQVVLILVFRIGRVTWSFRDCARMITQQELEVYVDISMHGASGSSLNKARILAKQFLIVMFFGHWLGCSAYMIQKWGRDIQQSIRADPDYSRTYFEKFEDEGNINYAVGASFWESYLLTLYKGFNLNYEDLFPEKPLDLMMEVTGSIFILLMKSYCIGSFFKYHQKREFEIQRFSSLMVLVIQFLDQYEVPPSLRKTVITHFRFQQANHRKIKTLDVISRLPFEIQKKLKELETRPIIVDRNANIFGTGLSSEYIVKIAMMLQPQFLQPSEVIFLEGEVPRELLFLDSGAVSFSRGIMQDGRKVEQLARYVRADRKEDPTLLGGVALILGCAHFFSARVRAGTEAVILMAQREEFDDLNKLYLDQHDLLIRNVAEAHLLDAQGRDLAGVEASAEHDTESFAQLQGDVRKQLQTRQESFKSAFMFAASTGDVKLVKELLAKRMEANTADYDKRSAVHLAASEGMSECLEALLQSGGDANIKDRWGSSPLQDALKLGYMGAAKLLRRQGGILELADPAGELCTCAAEGNTIHMQQLLDFGVDPNSGDYDQRTALHLSASEGHLPVVTFLTSRKADVNSRDRWKNTPMEDAIRNGYTTVARHLRACGGHLDTEFAANMLCDAASCGNLALLQVLFEVGVDTNEGDYDARTPTHLAAAEGQVLALRFLLNTARAFHSPLDRWQAAPLQDAVSGGHELCVQVLMCAGAKLGPSATKEQKRYIEKMASRLGFGAGPAGMDTFSEMTTRLQRVLGSHMALVEGGKARSDIFENEAAARFNKRLINKQVELLAPMCREALWLSQMLTKLESSTNRLGQMQRLLRDGASVASEARFWGEMGAFAQKSNHLRSKDATDMVIHQALLAGMRYAPSLVAAFDNTVESVLGWVARLKEETSKGSMAAPTPVAVSTLICRELLKELGWLTEEAEGLENMRNAAAAAEGDVHLNRLMKRVRDLVKALMPGEHLLMSILRGALEVPYLGPTVSMRDPSLHGRRENRGMAALGTWLDQKTAARLDGTAPPEGPLPTMPPTAPNNEIYGSLWPKLAKDNLDLEEEEGEEGALLPHEALRRLVASELVLLTLTALILEGWDRDKALPDYGRQDRQVNRGSPGVRRSGVAAFVSKNVVLTQEDFMDLGRVFRECAAACRGVPSTSAEERKALRQLMRKKEKAEKVEDNRGKNAESGRKPGDFDSDLADTVEAKDENLPIRVAKILALQDRMSLDELTILCDVDDDMFNGDGTNTLVFGTLSRERFVMNLLRCVLNHDENQKDILGSVPNVVAKESRGLWEDHGPPLAPEDMPVPCDLSEKELEELIADVTRMQEVLSQGASESEDEDGGVRRANVSLFVDAQAAKQQQQEKSRSGSKSRFTLFRTRNSSTSSMDSGAGDETTEDAGDEGPRRRCCSFLGCVKCMLAPITSFFGQEGRERRKRKRIRKRFRELDDDGDGIGTAEMAQLLAVAFHHTLGQEQELRYAYRVFELLNKADVGDLVTLPELFEVLPMVENEIREAQRKHRRGPQVDSEQTSMWPVTRALSRLVIPPESSFLQSWDLVRKLVVIYYVLEVPVRFSFLAREELTGWTGMLMDSMNWFADIFMALNVVLTFFRGFTHPTKGVISVFHEIRLHYVFNLFTVDVIACCPADFFLPENSPRGGLLARPRAAMRLLRLLHMRHLTASNAKSETSGFFHAAFSMMVMILLMVHFLACGWWLLGTRYSTFDELATYNETYAYDASELGDDGGSWTYTYVHRPGEPPLAASSGATPFWWQYLIAFYWSAGRLTGQSSPGNLFAASWPELGWICSMFLINVAVNGYCDGILVDKVIAGDEEAIEAKAMRRIVDEYLQAAELPQELIVQIRSAAEDSGKMVQRQRMEATIQALPHTLKQRIARRIFLPYFADAQIFVGCSESFLVELGAHCRIWSVGKDTQLAHPGEPANQLLVLMKGRIGVFSKSGTKLAETDVNGDMIGEMPFIFDLKYVVNIASMEESRLTMLPKEAFSNTCKLYPEDAMALRRSTLKVIQSASMDGEEVEDPMRRSKDKSKNSNLGGKAKSTMSFGTTTSASSIGESTTVSHALRRIYAGDLRAVVATMRDEQQAARQDMICQLIQYAADGDLANIEATLAKGEVHIDEADYDARTSLHLAVCNNHMEVVKTLVETYGASVHVKDRFDHAPINDAVREKRPEIANYLLSRGAQYQVDTSVVGQLCQAAFDNDVPTLQLILADLGVSPNISDYDSRTPLHLAASEGHVEVVKLLLNLPDIQLSPQDRLGNTPLDDSMRHNQAQARRMLQQRGGKMGDQNLGVVLCELGFRNNVDKLKELADSQVALDESDYDWRTCLHLAASEGHIPSVTYLMLDAKVDPNPLDRFLSTPLDDAVRHSHLAMAAFLKSKGGLSGSEPAMASRVQAFKERKKREEVEREHEKLHKEVKSAEVSVIKAALERFHDLASLEDDVHAFDTHARNFREQLLLLIRQSILGEDDRDAVQQQKVSFGGLDGEVPVPLTKEYREKCLEQAGSGLDMAASRLIATLEAEVLPWVNGISAQQERLLNVFMPGIRPRILRVVDQLKMRSRITRLTRKVWLERKTPNGNTGAYHCPPVALMLQRLAEAPMDIVHNARLEAAALLWASRPSSSGRGGGAAAAAAEEFRRGSIAESVAPAAGAASPGAVPARGVPRREETGFSSLEGIVTGGEALPEIKGSAALLSVLGDVNAVSERKFTKETL